MKTIIEPFRIKSVEPIKFTTAAERAAILKKAHYNPFLVPAEDVLIDLLTDSGTSAMSAEQWAGIMVGDESYAGAKSFFRFEKILFTIVGGKGRSIPNNTHFDTTRANVEYSGAAAVDLVNAQGKDPQVIADFKGNRDLAALEAFIRKTGVKNIPLGMITVTNNAGGGQPVSMENIRQTSALLKKYKIPFFIDACRFAENAWFIKQ